MPLFKKRKVEEVIGSEEAKIVKNGRDTIVLGPLLLTGQKEGNFYVQDILTVNADANIVGDVTATNCVINGKVTGNIVCAKELYLGATAVVGGSIMAKAAVIDTGCIINGTVLLAPRVETAILSIKIAEAENMLVNETVMPKVYVDSPKSEEKPKIDLPVAEYKPLVKIKEEIIKQKTSPIIAHPAGQIDNWW